jgi:hypothetical protein
MSSLPPIEGTVSAQPYRVAAHGSVSGVVAPPSSGVISGQSPESSAIAELGSLISSLGTLSAQAQSLPLSPPTLPGLTSGQNYRPQSTDYTQFVDDAS